MGDSRLDAVHQLIEQLAREKTTGELVVKFSQGGVLRADVTLQKI